MQFAAVAICQSNPALIESGTYIAINKFFKSKSKGEQMNKLFKVFLAPVLIAFAITSCGKNADQVVQDAKTTSGVDNGDYVAECTTSVIPGLAASVKETINLSSGNFTKKQHFYTDASCATESFVVLQKGEIVNRGSSSTVKNGQLVDFNYQSVLIQPSKDSSIKVLNTLHICSVTNWEMGKEVDISSIRGKIYCPGNGAPRTAYDIMLIDGSNLYLGANAEELEQAKRPVQLDSKKVLRKL